MDFSKLLKVVSGVSNGDVDAPVRQRRLDSFIPLSGRNSTVDTNFKEEKYIGFGRCRIKVPKWLEKIRFPNTIDPQSKLYLTWLFIVTFAFLYNIWFITLRTTFNIYQTEENRIYWWIFDYICDLIYILDIILFKARLRFLRSGLLENDRKETMKNYMKKLDFKLDMLCLMPLDILYIIPTVHFSPWVRFPRMFKILTFWEFFDRMDQAARSGHFIRIIKTMTYMSFLIHVETCCYYAMSRYQGIGSDQWVYNGEGIAYIRCLYLATKTATSIGKNPSPTNEQQWIFMTVYWLSGVFVFALLIGQIRDIFQSAGAIKNSYRKTLDQTIWYMESLNLPKELQDRVRLWLTYNWEQQKTLNENSLLDGLPKKMRTDLAINVHYHTLSKVQLFQDCDKNLLFDLVLKLKPVLYLPMDMICRKGEVGTEMYIVMAGQVEVVGGPNNDTVLATLSQGSVFGEISLLALAGGNRRTADVRSKGFSNLFILNKWDFEEAMRDYPEAQALLKKRAKKLLAQNAKQVAKQSKVEAEEVIKSRQGTPKLLKTVIQVVEPDSQIPEYLGFKKLRKHTKNQGKNSKSVPNEQQRTEQGEEEEHSDRDEDDVFDDVDDEILIIEQTEHPIDQAQPGGSSKNQTNENGDSKESTDDKNDLDDILGSQADLSAITTQPKSNTDKSASSKPAAIHKANSTGKLALESRKDSPVTDKPPIAKKDSNTILTNVNEINTALRRGSGSKAITNSSKLNTTQTKKTYVGSKNEANAAGNGGKGDSPRSKDSGTGSSKADSAPTSKPGSAGSSLGKKSKSPSPTTLKLMNNKVAPELESMSMNESRSNTPRSEDSEKALSCPPELIGKVSSTPVKSVRSQPHIPAKLALEKTQTAPVYPSMAKPQPQTGAPLKKMPTTPNLIGKKVSQPSTVPPPKKTTTPPSVTTTSKKSTVTPSVPTKKAVPPSSVQMKKLDLQVPAENKVTADVVVHREKNGTPPSVLTKKKGVDNPAFVAFSGGQSAGKDVKETEL